MRMRTVGPPTTSQLSIASWPAYEMAATRASAPAAAWASSSGRGTIHSGRSKSRTRSPSAGAYPWRDDQLAQIENDSKEKLYGARLEAEARLHVVKAVIDVEATASANATANATQPEELEELVEEDA